MIWKNALKYPVLAVGVILFTLYITNPKTKEYWDNHAKKFVPNSCEAVKERILKKEAKRWKLECPGTVRLIVKVDLTKRAKKVNIITQYRELANTLVNIGKLANPETLSYLKVVEVYLRSDITEIKAVTNGQALVELAQKKSQDAIAKHLKMTVKTQEIKVE